MDLQAASDAEVIIAAKGIAARSDAAKGVTDVKRILILTADAGFGHRSAANAIAAALGDAYGDTCEVNVVNPLDDERAPTLLRDSQLDYNRLIKESPGLYKFSYEASDSAVPTAIVEGALTVMLFQTMRDVVQRYQPDAIVSTYPLYQAPLSALSAIGKHSIPLLTVVTDLITVHRLWFNDASDLCLVPTEVVRDLAVEYGLEPDKVKITGIPVHPRITAEQRSRSAIRAELGWREDLTTVLAVGGARVASLPAVLHVLNHSGLPIQLIAIAGGDDDLHQQFQRTQWHLPTQVYNYVDDMPTFLRAADCVICKAGGLITTEALACGLPLLFVDLIAGQETGNASHVIDGGAGALAESPVDTLEILFHWLDKGGEMLAVRAANAQRMGRPRAAYDVAELAWLAATRGPSPRADGTATTLKRITDLLNQNDIAWQ